MAMSTWRAPAPALSATFGLGMALIYVGRRIALGGTATVCVIVGLSIVVAMTALRFVRARRVPSDRQPSERILALLYALTILAVALYFFESTVFVWATGHHLSRKAPRIAAAITTLWPALWALGALPVPLVEMSLGPMRRSPSWDRGRVRAAVASGLGVALVIVFAFAVQYAGRASDVHWDVAYFRTTRAGDATHGILRALNRPIEIVAFFPPGNEVGAQVDDYLSDLRNDSRLLTLTRLDHALVPTRASSYGVNGNGVIVVAQGSRHEQIGLPLQMERARGDLRKLDSEIHKRLVKLTRPARVAYFTAGHDEARRTPTDETDRRRSISAIYQNLEDNGWQTRDLGLAEGLGHEIPGDAAAVLVMGPRRPFRPEEARALLTWAVGGGHVLIALDPESGVSFEELLAPLGLAFTPAPLANDTVFWRRSANPAEHTSIITVGFSDHASVAGLAKLGARAPVILLGAGPLSQVPPVPPLPRGTVPEVVITVRSDANTWVDRNLDFENQSEHEPRGASDLVAAVMLAQEGRPAQSQGRVLVVGDCDVFSNIALGNPGNQLLFTGSLAWLAADEASGGIVNSEEDVPLTHTRQRDVVWFYTTIFLIPAFVVGSGVLATRRRRTGRARKTAAPKPAVEAPPLGNPQGAARS